MHRCTRKQYSYRLQTVKARVYLVLGGFGLLFVAWWVCAAAHIHKQQKEDQTLELDTRKMIVANNR